MAMRRPGFPAQLSSSCDVFDRAARHEQRIGMPESNTSTLLRGCVRKARIAASLTLEAASFDVGVHWETIKRWESGKTSPDVQKLLDAPKIGPFFRAQWDLAFGARRAA